MATSSIKRARLDSYNGKWKFNYWFNRPPTDTKLRQRMFALQCGPLSLNPYWLTCWGKTEVISRKSIVSKLIKWSIQINIFFKTKVLLHPPPINISNSITKYIYIYIYIYCKLTWNIILVSFLRLTFNSYWFKNICFCHMLFSMCLKYRTFQFQRNYLPSFLSLLAATN